VAEKPEMKSEPVDNFDGFSSAVKTPEARMPVEGKQQLAKYYSNSSGQATHSRY